jgi:hypothetical protein
MRLPHRVLREVPMGRDSGSGCVTQSSYQVPQGRTLPRGDGRGEVLEEALELAGPDGVLELADGLGLDLPDALAGDLEDLADFFQRV